VYSVVTFWASCAAVPADKGEPIDGSRRRNTGTPHRQVGGRLCSIGGFALVVAKVDPIRLSGAATSRSAADTPCTRAIQQFVAYAHPWWITPSIRSNLLFGSYKVSA